MLRPYIIVDKPQATGHLLPAISHNPKRALHASEAQQLLFHSQSELRNFCPNGVKYGNGISFSPRISARDEFFYSYKLKRALHASQAQQLLFHSQSEIRNFCPNGVKYGNGISFSPRISARDEFFYSYKLKRALHASQAQQLLFHSQSELRNFCPNGVKFENGISSSPRISARDEFFYSYKLKRALHASQAQQLLFHPQSELRNFCPNGVKYGNGISFSPRISARDEFFYSHTPKRNVLCRLPFAAIVYNVNRTKISHNFNTYYSPLIRSGFKKA